MKILKTFMSYWFKVLIIALILQYSNLTIFQSFSQIGINNNNPDSSAILDIRSINKGLLVPRVRNDSMAQMEDNTLQGVWLFDSTNQRHNFYQNLLGDSNVDSKWKVLNQTKYFEVDDTDPSTYQITLNDFVDIHIKNEDTLEIIPSGTMRYNLKIDNVDTANTIGTPFILDYSSVTEISHLQIAITLDGDGGKPFIKLDAIYDPTTAIFRGTYTFSEKKGFTCM